MSQRVHTDVSVIVPVYDCAPWLDALLASVLGQAGVALEVIAVCDGATDGSLAILEAAAARDPRLRVIAQENRGVSAARNVALAFARGEWIAFADGDDWMKPGALRAWIDHGRKNALDVVIGNGFDFDGPASDTNLTPIYDGQPWNEVVDGHTWMTRVMPNDDWVVCVWLQCMTRAFIERHALRFEEGVVHEDILWTLQFALKAGRIGFVREPFYGHRHNPASIVNAPSTDAVARRAAGYLRVIDALVRAARNEAIGRDLRGVLLRQANREGGHLLHVLRKRLHDAVSRRDLARRFLAAGYVKIMLKGATNASERWRALRAWALLRRMAR